jgi:hypothetical protein
MNAALLSLEQTPPLSVPLRFFLTAPLFGLLASLLLLYDGSLVLTNRWHPDTLALTHLLTLGFITMVMFGAMLQLLPVLAVSPVPRPVLVSTVLHILLTLGTLSLAAGFLSGQAWLMLSAIILLGLSFLGFISVVAYCLTRIKGRNPIFTAMRLALSALAVTAVLGIGLAMLFGLGITLPLPVVLTDLHLIWGLIGWVALLVMGVAYQVVPMFQITAPYPPTLTRWLIPLIFFILLLWTPFYILANLNKVPNFVPQLLMGLIGLGISVFALATLSLQARRLRKLPDVTLNYWRVGMIGLLLSVVLWLVGLSPVFLVVLFIAGFVLPVIQGMLYKIVPFLVWLHLQNQQLNILTAIQMVKLPNMKQIIPDRQARRQFWVYIVAFGLLIGAVLEPSYVSLAASVALIISFLLLTYNLYGALWVYRSVSRQIAANRR